MSTSPIFLGLGSNLGERESMLRRALCELAARGVRLHRVSSVYDTDPVGFQDQEQFLNAIPAQFDSASEFRGKIALVRLGSKSGYINRSGTFVWREPD